MFIVVVGGGKVGSNVARKLRKLKHEVVLIEQERERYAKLEEEFEHAAILGDGTELFVLEQAGMRRPPDVVVAVTGDDEDNLVICQLAKEAYGVASVVARVNDPRNQQHFDLLGISPTVSATSMVLALIQHEVPEHELVHLLELRKENLEIVEVEVSAKASAAGKKIEDLHLPRTVRLISVMRDGKAEIAVGATELRPGDQVLALLEPGGEEASPAAHRRILTGDLGSEARGWRVTWTGRKILMRFVALAVTAVSLYILFPSLLEVFTSWREVLDLEPIWLIGSLGFICASFLSTWALQRIAVGTRSWFVVGTSQLAGNSLSKVVPGGAATAGALQYRMLVRTGVAGGRAASGITASSALMFAILLGLPVLALPAVLTGTSVDQALERSAWLGAVAFGLLLVLGAVAFAFTRPLVLVANGFVAVASVIPRGREICAGLPERLVRERNSIRTALGARWKMALTASVGRWLFDYLALIAALFAVGATPSPSLVLLAFVGASMLGMVPFTPGGLGFVEAGLTGLLALAGVAAGAAVVATLAYRLASFWLPIPAGPAAYWLFRRRFPG